MASGLLRAAGRREMRDVRVLLDSDAAGNACNEAGKAAMPLHTTLEHDRTLERPAHRGDAS